MANVDVSNVDIRPVNVYFGENAYQVQKITCVADVSSSLNNKYFHIYSPAGVKYHVWYNVAAAGVDPAPAGSTAAVVAISANASASAVATATEAVIEALTDMNSTVSGAVITVTFSTYGYANECHDAQGASNQVGFSFETTVLGDTELNLGLLDGNVEVSGFDSEVKEIQAHQYGPLPLAQVVTTPKSMEIKLTLKEPTTANIKKIIAGGYGGSMVPVGSGASEIVGMGTEKNGKLLLARKLRLHPVDKGNSDYSQDITFWKSVPSFDSMAFSGEEFLMLPVTFKVFPDFTKVARANMFVYGDASQTLTE
jgi:hypothetical protein